MQDCCLPIGLMARVASQCSTEKLDQWPVITLDSLWNVKLARYKSENSHEAQCTQGLGGPERGRFPKWQLVTRKIDSYEWDRFTDAMSKSRRKPTIVNVIGGDFSKKCATGFATFSAGLRAVKTAVPSLSEIFFLFLGGIDGPALLASCSTSSSVLCSPSSLSPLSSPSVVFNVWVVFLVLALIVWFNIVSFPFSFPALALCAVSHLPQTDSSRLTCACHCFGGLTNVWANR